MYHGGLHFKWHEDGNIKVEYLVCGEPDESEKPVVRCLYRFEAPRARSPELEVSEEQVRTPKRRKVSHRSESASQIIVAVPRPARFKAKQRPSRTEAASSSHRDDAIDLLERSRELRAESEELEETENKIKQKIEAQNRVREENHEERKKRIAALKAEYERGTYF